ncbi:tRNA (cytidine(34)-2'-O)-methyltransferase [Algihabitans albus]|uniref:tRNA (cytidine(34)-2'-O)-methyltransferase n=1 Tax=Algihabitans albus TaxID=2164067 RepID=UPI000E5D5CA5|nr:tRNA (cytidine(34)-2'-O)-methyltransferase [Algihabitans albus]
MKLILYQPDIPQNAGTLLRLGACLGVAVEVIEPCGFVWDDRRLRRAGMDYLAGVHLTRHRSWNAYEEVRRARNERLVLLTTRGEQAYTDFTFAPDDALLLGRESAGVPDEIHGCANASLRIPLRSGQRSLNVAVAGAMVLGEALRQTTQFPQEENP